MRYNVRTRGREVKHQSEPEGKKFILTKNIKANKEFGVERLMKTTTLYHSSQRGGGREKKMSEAGVDQERRSE